jgi:hypothetical protein
MPNSVKRVTHGFFIPGTVKEGGGYFSDGLLNLFHFDKDLAARRKNPVRALGGDMAISHSLQNLVLGGDKCIFSRLSPIILAASSGCSNFPA